MYTAEKMEQMTFEDFNQSCGMKLDMNDEWIVVVGCVDRNAVKERYMELFPSKCGRPALGARMALGAFIIQLRMKPPRGGGRAVKVCARAGNRPLMGRHYLKD